MKKIFTYVFVLPGIIALLFGFAMSLKTSQFSVSYPKAVPTPTVELENGERFDLTASYVTKTIDGVDQTMMAYNGSVPGPVLRVKQGESVTIHFTNKIGQETLLHAHGVRMANAYDGTHLVQDVMKDGDSFDYTLTFPDPGVFIYHPHTLRDDLQQDLGLYGSIIVEPSDPNYWPKVDREENVILDDLLIEDGVIAPHSLKYATHALMGRFGNTMLINGETKLGLKATQGEVVRYYLTNTANTRTFAVTIPGARMKLVGGDDGRYEKEAFVDKVVLGPSERAVVDVLYEYAKVYSIVHNPGGGNPTYSLATVTVGQRADAATRVESFDTLRTDDAYAKAIASYRSYLDKAPDKTLLMTVNMDMSVMMGRSGGMMSSDGHSHGMMMGGGMGGMMGTTVPIEWEDHMPDMNLFSTDKDVKWILRDVTGIDPNAPGSTTPKDNLDVQWRFAQGDVVKVRLYNDPTTMHPMQHPFHTHGQRFLVLAVDGVPNDNLVWKDTALVPAGSTMDLLIPMENPGKWMAHCHILEHLAAGMVILFDVVPKSEPTVQ